MCVRLQPEKGNSAHGGCVGSSVADAGASGWQVAYDRARGYPFRFPFVEWSLSLSRFPPGFRNVNVFVELCSRAPRRIGRVGAGFADSNVDRYCLPVCWVVGRSL